MELVNSADMNKDFGTDFSLSLKLPLASVRKLMFYNFRFHIQLGWELVTN